MKYRQAWLDYCLINLTGQKGKFYANNRFGETIIKLNKKKVRPFANAKSDVFLRKTIALNVMSLWKSKEMLARATRATRHRNRHSVIDSRSNITLMVKLIGKTDVFKIQPGRGSPESSEFVDLFAKGSALMNTGVPLKNYKKRAKGNWGQSKDGTDMFEGNENADVKRNNTTTVDSDYDSDDI